MLSDGGSMTVTLLWLWEIQLTMTGLPERSPVVLRTQSAGEDRYLNYASKD